MEGMAEALLRLMPRWSLPIWRRRRRLCAAAGRTRHQGHRVDSSSKMIEVSREQALRHGVKTSSTAGRHGRVAIEDRAVDLVFFSQSLHHAAPERAIQGWRILVPGGRIVVLDLLKHRFEEAREITPMNGWVQ